MTSTVGAGDSRDFKFTNIIEWADIGVPLSVAYNAFTEFESWPDFLKKVENVEWTDDVTLSIKGQVMWSHRTWEATIIQMVADSHITWESTGEKGHISGSVSFHEVAPRLTRMVVVGEYHPQGFVERVGNIWFALSRRFRLELKFFVHHVMTDTILDPESVEGWRGEIRDGELVTSHEDALEQQEQEQEAPETEEDQEPAADEQATETEPGVETDEPVEDEVSEDEQPVDEEEPIDEQETSADEELAEESEAPPEETDLPEEADTEPEDSPTAEPAEYEESARRGTRSAAPASDTAKVRGWAKANGYSVSDRGRVPQEIRDAFYAAH